MTVKHLINYLQFILKEKQVREDDEVFIMDVDAKVTLKLENIAVPRTFISLDKKDEKFNTASMFMGEIIKKENKDE